MVPTIAREATQAFEDSRTIAVKREQQAQMKAQADAAAEAKAAAAAAEQQKMLAQQQAAAAQQQAADAAQAAAQADAAKQAAMAGQAAAQAQAAAARKSSEQLRADLLKQFNSVLPATDTPRGLVVNMGGVLFASGSYELRPQAREALAKLSGIVATQPGLKLAVEGHTDNVGSEETNQKLSAQRANTVRDFLVKQGLNGDNITAVGLGPAGPIASNDTAEGRGANRRVEIIVSGDAIGTQIGK
jgi:outer membrane protein OmpA-like peptidoglycan-associated protein